MTIIPTNFNPFHVCHVAQSQLIAQLVALTGCQAQTVKELPLAELARLRDEVLAEIDRRHECEMESYWVR